MVGDKLVFLDPIIYIPEPYLLLIHQIALGALAQETRVTAKIRLCDHT